VEQDPCTNRQKAVSVKKRDVVFYMMKGEQHIRRSVVLMLLVLFSLQTYPVLTESIDDIDRRAQKYYDDKQFTNAITEWMRILELNPENEQIQRKVEYVYEEKHRKDLALVLARKHYRLARINLYKDYEEAKENADIAINNFVTSYRIDPADPEVQDLREKMRQLQEDVRLEGAKIRLSKALKEKYQRLVKLAEDKMDMEEFEEALGYWNEILSFVPKDGVALEGKRKALFAINNRLLYERVRKLMVLAIGLFKDEKYRDSQLEFREVLRIDPGNDDAEDYLDKIAEKLNEKRNYELRRFQAEQYYISGIDNVRKNNFDAAEDDFESVIGLIENYKDAKQQLASIPGLRKEYERQQRLLKLRGIDEKFQKGLIALNAGRYSEAISFFDETVKLDPKNRLAKEYLKTSKEALQQKQEEEVDENSPYYNVINPLIVSGQSLFEKGKYLESRKRWVKILNVFPKNRIATEYLLKCDLMLNPREYERFSRQIIDQGKEFLSRKKFERALSQFKLIKSIAPSYPGIDALIARANTAMEGSKKEELQGASPADIERRYRLGVEYYRRGGIDNLKIALGHFRWVVARERGNMRAVINVNRISSQLRIGEERRVSAQRRLTPRQQQLVKTYYFRGINYYSNNQFNKAIAEWRKVLVIDPLNQKARNNIQKVLALMRR